MSWINTIVNADVTGAEGLTKMPSGIADCIVTSPPYFGLRDYGLEPTNWPEIKYNWFGFEIIVPAMKCCLGLESTPMAFVGHIVHVFRLARPVLKDDGTLWLNFGDSYTGYKANTGDTDYAGQSGRPEHKSGWQYGSLKPKDLIGIPWMVAFALRDDGWYLRSDVIWHKPNPMPESVTDRPTKSHEYIFLLSKSQKYYFDHVAIMQDVKMSSVERLMQDVENQKGSGRVPGKMNGNMKAKASWNGSSFDKGKTGMMMATNGGVKKLPEGQENLGSFRDNQSGRGSRSGNKERKDRPGAPENNGAHQKGSVPWEGMKANKRSVWTVTTKPFKEAHFATFPPDLIIDCIKAGSREGGLVLDLFMGAGTTALVARKLNRNYVGFELNPKYLAIANKRLHQELGMFV